jgi:uncharacterized protein (TIGR00290 family)
MGSRVAMFSGGKDGLRAASLVWPVDILLFLVYDFPEPSPHIENVGATIAEASLIGKPIVVARLDRGKEFEETADLLRKLNADKLIAGDVFVEDHLKYMESLASEAGASLLEPLWGQDTLEILMKDLEEGYSMKVLGARTRALRRAVGEVVDKHNSEWFLSLVKSDGADPLGEKGEYHTVVVNSPLHRAPLRTFNVRRISMECCDIEVVAAPFNQAAMSSYVRAFGTP